MVAVGVGQDRRGDAVPGRADALQPTGHRSDADSQVEQQARTAQPDQRGVASGTAGQGGELQRHRSGPSPVIGTASRVSRVYGSRTTDARWVRLGGEIAPWYRIE